jgi:acetyl esterase/lipase
MLKYPYAVGLVAAWLGFTAGVWADDTRKPDTVTVPYHHIVDVIYGRKYGMALTMDVYRPKRDSNRAAIIFTMSGGWVSRTNLFKLPEAGFLLQEPLKRGYTVFAVYHGSQPRYTIPEVVADMNRAVRFVRFHAKDYDIDPNRIGITGGSAGGHLSLMLGTAGDQGNPQAKDPLEHVSSRVQAVACFFPPTDFLNYGGRGKNAFADDGMLTKLDLRPAVDLHEFDAKTRRYERVADPDKITALLRRISPITHVSADDAPTLIVHGDADKLVPLQQAEIIIDRFKEVGVPAELVMKKGAGHTFQGMDAEYVRMIDWFDKYLKMK